MNNALFRLSYCSRSVLPPADAGAEAEMSSILGIARTNNAKVGVTGALLHISGCFAQVLEGPMEAVHETFERIQRDPRHHDVVVLNAERVSERLFGSWDMALAQTGNPAHATEILRPALATASPESGVAVVTMLSELVCREAAWAY